MWVGAPGDRAAARSAGLDAERGRIMVDAVNREAELEEISDALMVTGSDDFNALAAAQLRAKLGHGHVYRLAPDPEAPDLLPPSDETGILGDAGLTFAELTRRFADGARFITREANGTPEADGKRTDVPLFVVSHDGRLIAATDGHPPTARPGDTLIVLVS